MVSVTAQRKAFDWLLLIVLTLKELQSYLEYEGHNPVDKSTESCPGTLF